MPDRIEEILKEIHVLFAKGENYHDSPDRVVISKHEMFELLEDLNEALYDLMDKYEATARSREKARLEFDRESAQIVIKAKQDADDVHAASLLYTDNMLDQINSIIERTRHNVKHELLEMLAEIEDQQETIVKNKEGVRSDLSELHDSGKYLELLDKLRKEAENKRRFGITDFDEEEEEEVAKPGFVIRVDAPGSNSGVSISSKKDRKNRKNIKANEMAAADGQAEQASGDVPVPKGTVFTADDFDLDAEYEQWKDQNNGEGGDASAEEPKKSSLFNLFGHKK